MRKVTPITEQFQHFVEDLQESFWGDLCGRTRLAWKKFFEAESLRERDRYGIVTLIVLSRKGPHGFPFRRPHSRFPIH